METGNSDRQSLIETETSAVEDVHQASTQKIEVINANSQRLPSFYIDDPETWFLQADAIFKAERIISQNTRFYKVFGQLPQQIVTQIADLAETPGDAPYDALKKRLIEIFGATRSQKIQETLDHTQLGDQRPSQVLRKMKVQLGSSVTEEILQVLWTRTLPLRVQAIIVAFDKENLERKAEIADQVINISEQSTISPINNEPQNMVQDLQEQVERLTKKLDRLQSSKEYNHQMPTENKRHSFNNNDNFCYYHKRWGRWARNCQQPCQWRQVNKSNSPKKLKLAAKMADRAVSIISHRLFITCKDRRIRFLIDTGASISILPNNILRRKKPTSYKIYAANGSPINTFGTEHVTINLGTRRPYRWNFLVADVPNAIIGADFIAQYGLSVNLQRRKLTDPVTNSSIYGNFENTGATISTIPPGHNFEEILKKYVQITKYPTDKPYKETGILHYIETVGAPITSRARRLNPFAYEQAKTEFNRLLEEGIIRPSKSPWSSPLHIVQKADGSIRPCGDYRALNKKTIPDRYGVPNLRDFNTLLAGTKIYSTLDIQRAFHHIPIAPEDIPKTAIITPFGLYEYVRMGFGLRNAAQTYQRFMDHLLRNLPFAFCYLDDVLIASHSPEEHKGHLQEVFDKFQSYGLQLNVSKCVLGKSEVKFLGHLVSEHGIKPLPSKIDSINKFPKPKNITELRRFLGMVNFYRRSLPKAAEIQKPLTALLHNAKKNDKTPIIWNKDLDTAFDKVKNDLAKATLLAHPLQCAPLYLATDASETGIGAVLQQHNKKTIEPLGFFSKTLTKAQKSYSTYDRELLAIYEAIRHFRDQLEGRNFTILTDHKPLVYAITQSTKTASPQRIRQLNFISQFTTDIQYCQGDTNTVADALSRIETIDLTPETKTLAMMQQEDEELKLFRKTHPNIKDIRIPNDPDSIACDTSTTRNRPFIPRSLRKKYFDQVHRLSHPGIKTSRKLVAERYFWPKMYSDIKHWTQACVKCQQAKVYRHTRAPLQNFPPADKFDHVHLDIVGPLPPSQAYSYCLTMIDRATSWPECIPLRRIDAETVAQKFLEHWVSRFGAPARITTDQGRQFESALFHNLTKLLGSEKCRTNAYHPQANGKIERWHRCLKTAIMTTTDKGNWVQNLPTILLGLRSAVSTSDGLSAIQRVYHQDVRLPMDIFGPSSIVNHEYTKTVQRQLQESTKSYIPRDLKTAKYVYLRLETNKSSLTPPYRGPFKVIRNDGKSVTITNSLGETSTVSIDRCKAAYILNHEV